jgi:2'-5' RNA ligase
LEKTRVFLSLNADNSLVPQVKNIQEQLRNSLTDGNIKWEEPAKFHLTLRFLGDMSTENISSLSLVLSRLKFSFDEIVFNVTGIGFFPGLKHPNVVYAELNEKGKNSDELVGFIDRIIYNFGVKPDKRFIPHITLGRFSRTKRIKIMNKPVVVFEPFEAVFRSFYLMKSELKQNGSVYNVIDEYNFNNQN